VVFFTCIGMEWSNWRGWISWRRRWIGKVFVGHFLNRPRLTLLAARLFHQKINLIVKIIVALFKGDRGPNGAEGAEGEPGLRVSCMPVLLLHAITVCLSLLLLATTAQSPSACLTCCCSLCRLPLLLLDAIPRAGTPLYELYSYVRPHRVSILAL